MNFVFRMRAITMSACILFLMGLSSPVLAADGQHWEWVNTLPQGNSLNAVAWDGGSIYVAVGSLGAVLTSGDAKTWSVQSSGTTDILNTVAWGAGMFVAADNSGQILTSPDGATWTAHSTGSYNAVSGIVWNGTLFVAVGGSGEILTSADGINWTTRVAASVSGKTLYAVGWNGSQFAAVGESGTIRTSSDGINWVTQSAGVTASLYDVAWGGNQWVAVGGAILTSADGINWTKQNSQNSFFESVAWGGNEFVAVGGSLGLGTVTLTSPDGVTWTVHQIAPFALNSVIFDGGKFVAVGDGGKVATSADGTTWTSATQNIFDAGTTYESSVSAVAWYPGASKFLAVTTSGLAASSADGTSWSISDIGHSGMGDVACNSIKCVAVGSSGAIYTTGDGASWMLQTSGTSNALDGVAWDAAKSLFVAVGQNGTILTSPDGTTWTSQTSGTTNVLEGVAAGGKLVAVGLSGTILTSADGVNWTAQSSGTTNSLADVAYNGTQFLAISMTGDALTSLDGITWSAHQVSSAGSVSLNAVAWDGQVFIAGAAYSGGKIFTSPDGANWTAYQTGANAAPRAIASNGDPSAPVDVIGGDYGTLLASIQPAARNLVNKTITQPQSGNENFAIQGMGALSVSVSSNDQMLLPDANINGASSCTAAGSCTLAFQPAAGQTGTATVTVVVTDAYGQSTAGSFDVTVNASSSGGGASGSGGSGGGSFGAWALFGLLLFAGIPWLHRSSRRLNQGSAGRQRKAGYRYFPIAAVAVLISLSGLAQAKPIAPRVPVTKSGKAINYGWEGVCPDESLVGVPAYPGSLCTKAAKFNKSSGFVKLITSASATAVTSWYSGHLSGWGHKKDMLGEVIFVPPGVDLKRVYPGYTDTNITIETLSTGKAKIKKMIYAFKGTPKTLITIYYEVKGGKK